MVHHFRKVFKGISKFDYQVALGLSNSLILMKKFQLYNTESVKRICFHLFLSLNTGILLLSLHISWLVRGFTFWIITCLFKKIYFLSQPGCQTISLSNRLHNITSIRKAFCLLKQIVCAFVWTIPRICQDLKIWE